MSLLVPSLHGIVGQGAGGSGVPSIGNRAFWWAADMAAGSFTDLAATVPAANNSRVAVLKSATGEKFSQTDITNRPQFRANQQNSLPSLYFQHSRHDRLESPTGGLLAKIRALAALTVLIVWRPGSAGDYCAIHWCPAHNGLRLGVNTSNRVRGYRRGNLSASDEAIMTSAETFTRASAALFTYTGFGGTFRWDDNHGHSDTGTADAAEGGTWTDGMIGAAAGNADQFQGDLFEILVWDVAADNTQRTAALAYATAKWGLT